MSTFKFNSEEFNSLIPTSNLFNAALNKGKYLFVSAENVPYGEEEKSFTSFMYRHEETKKLVKFTKAQRNRKSSDDRHNPVKISNIRKNK